MGNQYLLGIDIGTQGTKTSLVSVTGKILADAFLPSNLIRPGKGMVEQDPGDIYRSVINTIKEVMVVSGAKPAEVLAIGIDGQMAGILGIDKYWNAVTPYDSWLDTRCEKYMAAMKEMAEDRIISVTGCPVTYAHGPKILWWKNERYLDYKRIEKFLMPSAYVVGKLVGLSARDAFIDYTHLHFSGFGDIASCSWSQELLDSFAVNRDKMPEIVEPWKVIGGLSKEAAESCGLISGIPVVAGCGDAAATSLGAGITRPGMVFDVAGTASVLSCCVDSYRPDVATKTLIFSRSVIPGLWNPLAYINGGGLCLKWFKDNLTGERDSLTYSELDKATEGIAPGSDELIFLPHFSGRVCPNNPNIRGGWLGLSWTHTRGHMYKAILESIAYEYNFYLKTARNLMGDLAFTEVITIGGGAKSRQFNQIKADVLGIKYRTKTVSDTATLGAAIVAGYGVEVFNSLESAASLFGSIADEILPEIQKHCQYSKFTRIYEEVIQVLQPSFRSLLN